MPSRCPCARRESCRPSGGGRPPPPKRAPRRGGQGFLGRFPLPAPGGGAPAPRPMPQGQAPPARAAGGPPLVPPSPSPSGAQAGPLLQQASGEFAKQTYGGAWYLANQTKSLTSASRSRLGGAGRPPLRPGEVSFAVPVRLRATVRSKVREGPGAAYKVLFTVEPGAGLVGYSYVERWVRVGDESGRAGWMFLSLVGRRPTEPGGR